MSRVAALAVLILFAGLSTSCSDQETLEQRLYRQAPRASELTMHQLKHRAVPMDDHLVQADFVGVVTVSGLYVAANGAGYVASVVVKDTWFSRWSARTSIDIPIYDPESLERLIKPGATLLVLLSGGAGARSSFTHHQRSIFQVNTDGTLTCESGNRLFGVHNAGFVCSTPDRVVGPPLKIGEVRPRLLSMKQRAAKRLNSLNQQLANSPRDIPITQRGAAVMSL